MLGFDKADVYFLTWVWILSSIECEQITVKYVRACVFADKYMNHYELLTCIYFIQRHSSVVT